MNLAKVSSSGQITVPLEVRRALNLKPGDKVLFIQNERGQFTIGNASAQAIYKAQTAFEGVAEKMGIKSEEDVQALVNEVRYEK
ncbi:MAG TPA: AbrB/MazE/SpoVT family DNA-binding domain-containing protein [Clostridiales bacterium]|nr:AbrB/MazE/SpoVT family DNA-binding domain-containing protein [Clostridiales bacterium]